ncbi:MAG TPA: methyltransferase domain-containing protein [Gaiellaceae bacterium]|jgi:SAM-dependent methyltransferase|nr:methyltransferase domain-containing protein [Gaiellaceae bacterium]
MEPTEENLRAWEDTHRARAEPVVLPRVVQRTLGDLQQKRVLHLLCGRGEATAALAELGAVATGVDPRPAALEAARERWPKILWVDGDPQSLPRQLRRGRFDLVYSGEGVLDGLRDLDGWAAGIAAALRAHGELLVFDDHPVADCVDGLLRWRSDYFRDPEDPDGLWRLGQVVSALARVGLHVEALEEYPGGTSRRRHDRRIPATFLLYARRAG